MKIYAALIALVAYGVFAFVHLASNQGASSPVHKGSLDGFWGVVESSVDWCEPNYVAVDQIAEFHNTVSSLLIVFAGLFSALNFAYCGCEVLYSVLGVLLAIVGAGSVAFHMTLQRGMQALDEVPMLWVATFAGYALIEHAHIKPLHRRKLFFITAYVAAISAITGFTSGPLAVAAFHFSFFPSEMFMIVKIIKLVQTTKDRSVKTTLQAALVLYAIAVITWCTDIVFCGDLQRLSARIGLDLQLHAYGWHLCIAAASYGLLLGVAADRQRNVLKRKASIRFAFGLLPVLSMAPMQK